MSTLPMPRSSTEHFTYLYYDDANNYHLQAKKTHGEVYARDSIHDDEDIGIGQLLEAEIQAGCYHREHNNWQRTYIVIPQLFEVAINNT